MSKVPGDIDYIYKEYDLVGHQYQEINQDEKVRDVKNKWVASVMSGQNFVNISNQEPLDIPATQGQEIANAS